MAVLLGKMHFKKPIPGRAPLVGLVGLFAQHKHQQLRSAYKRHKGLWADAGAPSAGLRAWA